MFVFFITFSSERSCFNLSDFCLNIILFFFESLGFLNDSFSRNNSIYHMNNIFLFFWYFIIFRKRFSCVIALILIPLNLISYNWNCHCCNVVFYYYSFQWILYKHLFHHVNQYDDFSWLFTKCFTYLQICWLYEAKILIHICSQI